MKVLGVLASLALIVLVLRDGFETMVLPRQVTNRFRYTRFFFRVTWRCWRALALRLPAGKRRQTFLSWFGPLSVLSLFSNWMLGLILGFAWLQEALGCVLQTPDGKADFWTYLYLSGVTFFTVGYGDVTPAAPLGRLLAVAESGLGLGFLAVVIGYLPVLYQAFSRREVTISLLDARAGSPPSVAQVLFRVAQAGKADALDPFLAEWERWAAELLESHLSFPVLSHYRSQHDNQSWLAAVTTMLDTCTFLMVGVKNHNPYQAQLTFAMARHAVVDLALVFKTLPLAPDPERLSPDELRRLQLWLRQAGLDLREGPASDARLAEIRGMYEPFVNALAQHFLLALPPILPAEEVTDNWQRSAWMRRASGFGSLPLANVEDDHLK
ncbi:MAG: two pore domain potassium channel family protein [Planctomycetes bacterium]|nr:two pore domain potassium channel family protein [Planctomycetota bacterium]